MDTEALSRELVRALRASRSQRALSRRLHYAGNVAWLWESGRRYPTLASFLWLAHRTGVDVGAALGRLAAAPPEPWSAEAASAWLRALRGAMPVAELARRVGRNRFAVARWLSGATEPRLPEALALIEACTARALDLVAGFADPSALPSVAGAWQRLEAARKLTRELPWAPAVLLALELEAYRALPAHDDAWVAARLGLPVEVVAEAVQALEAAGQLRRERGRLARVEVQAVDTRTTERRPDLKRWWAQVGLDRIGADGLTSFNLFTVSQSDFERLVDLQRRYFRELRAIVAESSPAERVVLTNLQLLALDA